MNSKGKLIIFSAPSGAGKTSIVKALLRAVPELDFSISATSRSTIRPGEINGKDYHFITEAEFKKKIDNHEFVEWEEVYSGTFYGTLLEELERIWNNGKHVIFDNDVKGGLNLKEKFGKNALAIFVKPPDINTLKNRLTSRATENEDKLKERIEKAEYEMKHEKNFDKVVLNRDLNSAIEESIKHVKEFLN